MAASLQIGCDDSVPLECGDGFVDEDGICVDVDECSGEGEGHSCLSDDTCTNTDGSYTCECDEGFGGDGGSCIDLDECAGEGAGHDCHQNAICTNTEGSFTCECIDGYGGDGRSCADLDECAGEGGGHDCHSQAACTNVDGDYTCECREGFGGDGRSCTDLDECAGEGDGDDCHLNAICTNTDGNFTCECTDGYEGDGRSCADLDECDGEGSGHDCHAEAACSNTDGDYLCACNEGYEGDGRSCERIRDDGLVIQHATLLDGSGAEPFTDAAIVIVEERVVEIGLTSTIFVYPDDQVLDVEDRAVMPGIINAHVHYAYSVENLEDWAQSGVTTIREVGAPLYPAPEWSGVDDWDDWAAAIIGGASVEDLIPPPFVWRDEELDRPESARALMSGPCMTATGGYPGGFLSLHVNLEAVTEDGVEITPVEDARRKTEMLVDAGADVIKICLENHWGTTDWGLLTQEQIEAIVEVAHSGGLRVTAHVSADEQLSTCLDADPSVDSAAHIVTDFMSDENITAMVDRDVTLVPTLAVWESLSWICTDFGVCDEVENLGRFVEAGGIVAMGDDYGNPGIDLGMPIRDMELMQEAGMTNMEIIVAATRDNALDCGIIDDLGTIETGKIADIIVLNDDPLTDITAVGDVAYVIRDGVIIRSP